MKTLMLFIFCFAISFCRCFGQEGIENRYASSIRNELLEMGRQVDIDRSNTYIINAECGANSKDAFFCRRICARHDSINLLKIKSIIHVYGYPGPKLIGNKADQVMFDLIYRTPVDTAKKFVSLVWQALQNGKATPENYAALADKVSMQESHAQLYGSIVQRKGGTFYMPPILDSIHVDSTRKTIGLPPLKEYLKQFN